MSERSKPLIDNRALAYHKKRFLRFFPEAFLDQLYIDWERTYKWEAHKLWKELLNKKKFQSLLRSHNYQGIASRALRVESGCNFLFSFEKMALRDALRTKYGAQSFSEGIYQLLYGRGSAKSRFAGWIATVADLPRKKARVCSWPVVTFFPFIAQPKKHIILKPTAMKETARILKYEFDYSSKPNFKTYRSLLDLADYVGEKISDLGPKDYHDLQSFLWAIGSAEYARLSQEI